jgi:ferritin-like metal-binding protein YciE
MNPELEQKISKLSQVFAKHVNKIKHDGMSKYWTEEEQLEMKEITVKMYALENEVISETGLEKKDITFYASLVEFAERYGSDAALGIKDNYPFFEKLMTTLNSISPPGTCPIDATWDEALEIARNSLD